MDEKIQKAAEFITSLNPIIVVGFEYLPELKRTLEELETRKHKVVSAAPIIGEGYRKKELNYEYRIERLSALINLLEAYKKSEETIKEINSLDKNREMIDKMF